MKRVSIALFTISFILVACSAPEGIVVDTLELEEPEIDVIDDDSDSGVIDTGDEEDSEDGEEDE